MKEPTVTNTSATVSSKANVQFKWQNIALLTLVIFYLTQFSLDLFVWKIMFGNLGGDYSAYWSAAKIANESGYVDIYELDKLEEIQRPLSPPELPFGIRPVAYLPVFILPFQFFALIDPYVGYWIWTLLNVIISIYYLRFFIQRITGQPIENRLLFMLLLSLPFFTNLFFGQINIWLMICIGEHLRAALAGKPFQAGLWLGGLIIKPHYLIVIGFVLLFQRYIKILAGFTVSSALITGLSFLMIGIDGFKALLELWFGYANSLPTADPFIMMNWRMVGINLALHFGSFAGWFIAIIGMAITLAMVVYLWRKRIAIESSLYPIALMGTIAATMSLTWHSHIFSGVIVLAPLAYLAQKDQQLPEKTLFNWVFIPPIIQFVVIFLAILIRGSGWHAGPMLNLLNSGSQLWANMVLLYWTVTKFRTNSIF
jgi:Protein of unknown function (DUF2029).